MLSDLKNPLHLSESALESLEQILQLFHELDEALPSRLLQYLVDGDDETAIADLVSHLHQQFTQYQQAISQPGFHGQIGAIAGFGAAWSAPLLLTQHLVGDKSLLSWLQHNILSDAAFYSRFSLLWACLLSGSAYASSPAHLPSLQERLPLFLKTIAPSSSFSPRSLAQADQASICPIPATVVEALYVEAGEPAGTLARLVYLTDPRDYQQQHLAGCAVNLQGFADYTLSQTAVVQEALQHADRERRIHALKMLIMAGVPIESMASWVEAIANSAVSSAKSEREVATILLQQVPQVAIPVLQATAEAGDSGQRQQAVKLLAELGGESVQLFLEERLAAEKTAKVKATLQQILAAPTDPADTAPDLALPPLPELDLNLPVPPQAIEILEKVVEGFNRGRVQSYSHLLQRIHKHHQGGRNWISFFDEPLSTDHETAMIRLLDDMSASPSPDEQESLQRFSAILDQHFGHVDVSRSHLVDTLQTGSYEQCKQDLYTNALTYIDSLKKEIKSILALPEWTLLQTVRLLACMGYLRIDSRYYNPTLLNPEGHALLLFYRNQHPDCGGLRELAAVLEVLGLAPNLIGIEMLDCWSPSGFWHWGHEAIWPYFAERSHLLEESLAFSPDDSWSARYENRRRRKNAFRALKTFPQPPAPLLSMLWTLALEGPKAERQVAQDCLNGLDETQHRVLVNLADPNREKRAIAAEWLGDRGDPAAIEPIKEALRREKSDAVQDLLLRSLEKLGASVEEFLDRDNLLKDSQALLKKGIPAGLSWFPFEAMPTVHWSDTGEPVATDSLKGLMVQCWKQKTPEPGPILKRYVEMWQPEEREALGQYVLESWMTQDTLPTYTPQEAAQLAQQRAQQNFQYFQQLQQQYPNATGAYYHTTFDDLYRGIYNELLRTCRGSAIKEKGILAIASACCGLRAVAPISAYLNTWYGQRMAQCKALLQVLAWMDHNSATQLLLAVANRFRTKGIQKEAEALVTELAERKGWSRDELSDRTIPTAGFDEGVEQILDFGSRQFTLMLDTTMSLVLKNPEGKVIKSLPAPRKDDDPELVSLAKKQLADAKKQLKQVLTLQRERLYEAMCTQRAWLFSDWDTYLNRHPIVGRYCQRLVWAIYEGDTLVTTTRPLEDRTLTDAEDEEVTPAPDALLRLAHSCTVPAEAIAAWTTHFADYEVTPLLQQFHSSPYVLPPDRQQDTELNDVEGHIIEALKLRGLLTKRGYSRGQTEDAGWFYDYRKIFSGLGIEVVIGFSGNYLPEENRPVALTTLAFYPLPEEGESDYLYSRPKLPLGDLPPVLLSEVWSELQAIAAQGSGYDPNWEKTVGY